MSNYYNANIDLSRYDPDILGPDEDEKISDQRTIDAVKKFTKLLKTKGTINIMQMDTSIINDIWVLVMQYDCCSRNLEIIDDPLRLRDKYTEYFQVYKVAKDALNQISELLSEYDNESDIREPTYLDILRFWIRISNDFLDRSIEVNNIYLNGGTCIAPKSTFSEDLEFAENIDKLKLYLANIRADIKEYTDGIIGAKRSAALLTPLRSFKPFKDKNIQVFSKEEVRDYYIRCKKEFKFLKSKYLKLTSLYRIEDIEIKMDVYRTMNGCLDRYLTTLHNLTILMEAHPSELMSVYLEDNPELNEFIRSTIQDIIEFNDSGVENVSENPTGYKHWKIIKRRINDPINVTSFSGLTMANITKCSTIYLKKSVRLGLKDFDLTMIDIIVKYFYFMEIIYFQVGDVIVFNRGKKHE